MLCYVIQSSYAQIGRLYELSLIVDLTLYSRCLPRLKFAHQVIFVTSVTGVATR